MIYASNNNHRPTGGLAGNQIMRVMSLIGLSEKYNTDFAIPDWQYAKYFENNILELNNVKVSQTVREPHFHHCDTLLDGIDLRNRVVDLQGYFQSTKYWTGKLRFKPGFTMGLLKKYNLLKDPIVISIRRGDFVTNPLYFQLPEQYYNGALINHFPDYEKRIIYFCSDDLDYCRKTFRYLANAIFVDAPPIEQLGLMNLCRNFIISNSTFSYVGAYLADAEKVIRPVKNFDGNHAKKHSEETFWPKNDNWIIYDF